MNPLQSHQATYRIKNTTTLFLRNGFTLSLGIRKESSESDFFLSTVTLCFPHLMTEQLKSGMFLLIGSVFKHTWDTKELSKISVQQTTAGIS